MPSSVQPDYYELGDRLKYRRLREALFNKRSDLAAASGVSIVTLGRLERDEGWCAESAKSLDIYKAFSMRASERNYPLEAFDEMFKPSWPRPKRLKFGWRSITNGAARWVGQKAFIERFPPATEQQPSRRADAMLTFSGHSSLLANLALIKTLTNTDEMLDMPVFLAQQRRWKRSSTEDVPPTLPGFTTREGDGVVVLFPDALAQFAVGPEPKNFVVIDDSITSGVIPPVVRDYFENVLRYPRERLRIVSALWYDSVLGNRKPDFYWKQVKTKDFELPWGDRLYFGE